MLESYFNKLVLKILNADEVINLYNWYLPMDKIDLVKALLFESHEVCNKTHQIYRVDELKQQCNLELQKFS